MANPTALDELRPLTPRSIVLSVLLGQHPPRMPVGRLLEFTSLFGIADGTVRTALSRLTAAGDVVAEDGTYRLSERLIVRQAEQDAGRAVARSSWDGSWWLAVVLADRRSVSERREFRARATGARLGELRPDVWIRPANIEVTPTMAGVAFTRGPLLNADGVDLAGRLWPLDDLDRRARHLIGPLESAIESLGGSPGGVHDAHLPPAFTALAAAQRFLRTEPQLPPELSDLRAADVLRERYTAAGRAFQRALEHFFGQVERVAT